MRWRVPPPPDILAVPKDHGKQTHLGRPPDFPGIAHLVG